LETNAPGVIRHPDLLVRSQSEDVGRTRTSSDFLCVSCTFCNFALCRVRPISIANLVSKTQGLVFILGDLVRSVALPTRVLRASWLSAVERPRRSRSALVGPRHAASEVLVESCPALWTWRRRQCRSPWCWLLDARSRYRVICMTSGTGFFARSKPSATCRNARSAGC